MRRKYVYPLRVLLGIKCYLCLHETKCENDY